MKKRQLIIMFAACLLLATGCSMPKTPLTNTEETFASSIKSNPQYDVSNAIGHYTYEYEVEDSEWYEYEIWLVDKEKAVLSVTSQYSYETFYTQTTYIGTYELSDTLLVFDSRPDDDEYSYSTHYDFTLVDNKIDKLSSGIAETDFSEIVGSYTCEDMTLTVSPDGSAVLDAAEGTFNGNFMLYDGKWDYMATLETDYNNYIDWIIMFDEDTFTYEGFARYRYKAFAGTITANGDLGVIDFVINEDGNVTADIIINGKTVTMTGSITLNEDNTKVTGLFLSGDDYSSVSLDLEDLGGEYNYSGTLTLPLSAG